MSEEIEARDKQTVNSIWKAFLIGLGLGALLGFQTGYSVRYITNRKTKDEYKAMAAIERWGWVNGAVSVCEVHATNWDLSDMDTLRVAWTNSGMYTNNGPLEREKTK